MRTKLFFSLVIPALFIFFICNNCSKKDDDNDPLNDVTLTISQGDFNGSTSKNQDVYLHVNNQFDIDSITVKIKVNFVTYYCTYTFYCSKDISIDKTTKQFEAKLTNPYIFICGESDYPIITGTFEDDNNCSGTISDFKQCGGLCGSSLSFGSGSTVSEQTWTAVFEN
ncbi:MAG: hypothetical protein JXJ22_15690 [Bacteroidales bacterium]|nr:hypothetical protein [Bacteroidales bacterium]